MRALTLTQPWAGLVASGIKLVDNRPRPIIKREDFGEPFALHASREISDEAMRRIIEIAPDLCADPSLPWFRLASVTRSVIAVATLRDAMYIGGCNDDAIAQAVARAGLAPDQARWAFGPTAYVLGDVRALRAPVPCRGYQGFWTLPPDIEARVKEQLR